ncbi:MAG: hypothetical protein HeimC2_37790, partial [Candidatus Heimdallarchaeota archaeon LC_2]
VDGNNNNIVLQSEIPFWAQPLVLLADLFLIWILSILTFYGWLFSNGGTEMIGELIFIILIDIVIISLFVQVIRGSEIALEINLVLVIGLFSIVFLYLGGGGGIPGATS